MPCCIAAAQAAWSPVSPRSLPCHCQSRYPTSLQHRGSTAALSRPHRLTVPYPYFTTVRRILSTYAAELAGVSTLRLHRMLDACRLIAAEHHISHGKHVGRCARRNPKKALGQGQTLHLGPCARWSCVVRSRL
eukprot:1294543-Rhodomonas_salina.1